MLFITHDLSLLVEFSDRIAIMYGGRIVEEAAGARCCTGTRCTRTATGCCTPSPALRGPRRELTGIPGSPPDLRAMPTGCSFHPRCPKAFDPCARDVPVLGTAGRHAAGGPHGRLLAAPPGRCYRLIRQPRASHPRTRAEWIPFA